MQIVIRYQCLQALSLKKLYKSLINVAGQFHDFDYNQQNVESYDVYHTLPSNRLKTLINRKCDFICSYRNHTHTLITNKRKAQKMLVEKRMDEEFGVG